MDVSWSPIHPALFSSVDGNGKLSLWNLNHDTEVRFPPSLPFCWGSLYIAMYLHSLKFFSFNHLHFNYEVCSATEEMD